MNEETKKDAPNAEEPKAKELSENDLEQVAGGGSTFQDIGHKDWGKATD